jgi:hypothetical protein
MARDFVDQAEGRVDKTYAGHRDGSQSGKLKQKENSVTNTSAVPEAGPAQAASPSGRFFGNQTFHFETLRNAGYILSNCAGY